MKTLTDGQSKRSQKDEPYTNEPYAEGVLGRIQRWEWRHRKIVFPVATIAAIGVAWLIDPGDWKWPISMLFLAVVGYQVAKGRASNDDGAAE